MTTATSLAVRVLETIRRHGMLHGGDVVLAAVSGGADSVALLDLLLTIRPELGISLSVVHVDHGLRPEAAAEADTVRRLCDRFGVACRVERVAVPTERPWDGLEAESRRVRHAAWARVARAVGATAVATGHTADDQAETVLMRLLQGAGPRGLAGIAPVRGLLISPLIETRRMRIEEHLRARGLDWTEDPSNREPRFLRNRIRHDVLPFLAELTGSSVVEALCRSAALARRVVADLEARALAELDRLGTRELAGYVLPVAALEAQPNELAAEILVQAAARQGETVPLRAPAHRALRRLLNASPRRSAMRLGRLAVERSGGLLRVGPPRLPPLPTRAFVVPGVLELPEIGARLVARVLARADDYTVPREPARVAFDADALPAVLTVRARRRGEVWAPFGAPSTRRLKSFLIDAGVPRWQRPRTPVIEAGGDILWLAGLRRGRAAPVTSRTARVLEIELRGDRAQERSS